MAIWTLVPDKLDDVEEKPGAFVATLIAFFRAEMGDKTQIANVALEARFYDVVLVTIETTLAE